MATRTFYSDAATEAAIKALAKEMTDASFSAIVRNSLIESAAKRRIEAIRTESLALRDDPDDRAEAQAIAEEMAELGVW